MKIAYSVIATLPDAATTAAYIAWLSGGHIDQVLANGASSAAIVRITEPAVQVESRYTFPDRATFDRYVSTVAPALRAEGVKKFPTARFERRLGELVR